jgi:hypothetical protein
MMELGLRERVRDRAGFRCEYCRLPEVFALNSFHLDHVVPSFHGGDDGAENRALCCASCNARKGTNLAGFDPDSGQLCELFNPRRQTWADHFVIEDGQFRGKTATGRTTVWVCDMNEANRLRLRRELVQHGLL